jgi:hypothetical protein
MKATRKYTPNNLKKILENDRRVLRFLCMDDTNSMMYGGPSLFLE